MAYITWTGILTPGSRVFQDAEDVTNTDKTGD